MRVVPVAATVLLSWSVCAGAIVACSDYSSSSGPGDAVDAGPIEATPETSPPLPDAGVDASTCDATFCDDFDHGSLGDRWTTVTADPSVAFGFTTSARSLPRALHIVLDTDGGVDGGVSAVLEKNLGRGTKLRCTFALFVTSLVPTNGLVDLFGVRTAGGNSIDYHLLLGVSSPTSASLRDDFFISDGGCACPKEDIAMARPIAGRWVAVTLQTDFTTASISYDGVEVLSGAFGGIVPSADIFVTLGAAAYGVVSLDVAYDDVMCSVE